MARIAMAALIAVALGCGGGDVRSGRGTDAGARDGAVATDAGGESDGGSGAADGGGGTADGGRDAGEADAGPAPITAAAVLDRLGDCTRIGGDYATDSGGPENVPVCGDTGVVWWQADMDIDCDGGREASCMADPWYLPETSGTDSSGEPLDANTLPFVVIPVPSSRFRYADHGIAIGQVALVLYDGRMEWAIFGDAGPSAIIGEGSYALAVSLGIDPDPATGGVESGVTYVFFTGDGGRVEHNESHDEAVTLGQTLARDFLSTTP